ncbi:hypothetical protein HZB88_03400 [archaeon]|nr:hypothetical protein [archaeon]
MKEKTKITLIAIGIILIVVIFLFNFFILPMEKLVKPLVQKYDFSTGVGINKWVYEGFSDYNNTIDYSKQIMPKITDGKEFSKEKYEQLVNLNDNVFVKTETSENGKHAFQIFKFNLGDLRNFTYLKITWNGVGTGAQLKCLYVEDNKCTKEGVSASSGTNIHLWHENGKFWTWVGGTELWREGIYQEFSKEIIEESTRIPMHYYLDSENNIYILTITAMPANSTENIPSVLKTDYIGIEVK